MCVSQKVGVSGPLLRTAFSLLWSLSVSRLADCFSLGGALGCVLWLCMWVRLVGSRSAPWLTSMSCLGLVSC